MSPVRRIATNLAEIIARDGAKLRALRGRRVACSWVAVDPSSGELHVNTPVVLVLESGETLELWSEYIAEFGVTWNTIDLSARPFDWTSLPETDARWVVNGAPALAAVFPNVIGDVALLRNDPQDGFCGGVELTLEDGQRLIVANDCDELYLETGMPGLPFDRVPWSLPVISRWTGVVAAAASSRSFDGYPRELTAAEVSPSLATLIRALAARLLDGPSEEHRTLLRQLAAARIEEVRLTGVGLFAYFVHPPDTPSVSPAEMIGGEVLMRIPTLDAPAGSLVVIHEGKLSVVEIYTYGQLPWPDEPRDVSFEETKPLTIPPRGD